MTPGRPSAAQAGEVRARAEEAIRALRAQEGPLGRWLRVDGPELLDLDSTPAGVKKRILDDVERLTRLLMLDRLWMRRIAALIVEARRTRRGKPVRIVDVGTGGGGLLARIDDWARRRRISVELHGVDYDQAGVDKARRRFEEEGRRISVGLGDARDLKDLADGGVDLAITTFMLHHFPPGDVACVLAALDRVAAVNFFAFDLRRSVFVLPPLLALLRLGRFEAPTRHDSVVSLRRGYTTDEMRALLRAAGVQHAAVESLLPAWMVVTRD